MAEQLGRDAFLYLDPLPPKDEFAQCATCTMWVRDDDLCTIHGPHVDVQGSASCGLYIHGHPQPSGTPTYAIVLAEESGLVDREVRCENCRWGGADAHDCQLFNLLNKNMPALFELDTRIDPKGCCNAQQPGWPV